MTLALVVAACAVLAAVLRIASESPSGGNSSRSAHKSRLHRTTHQPSLARLVGQLIVGRYNGPRPDSGVLARVRRGQLGGVILYGDNTTPGLKATKRAVDELQAAARQGGNPPLLIMTDQEGGAIRPVPGPQELAPGQMSSTSVARSQGASAGALLRSAGVNVDLAPVADVEAVPNFLGTRSFGSDPTTVAARACAFAQGLQSAGVLYTLKHFPGLGRAPANTDSARVSVDAPAVDLRADYAAYRRCGSSSDALIMISSAVFPTLSGPAPAVMSPEIYHHELPIALGHAGHPTISDALGTPALSGLRTPALRAIEAGLDLALFSVAERDSAYGYRQLLADAQRGTLSRSRVEAAANAIEALKRRIP